MAIQTYNKDKIDELFALRYVANTSLIKDLDLDDYEDKAIIINQENSKQYQLDKSATATADLGKWKELASDAVIGIDALPTTDIKTNIIYYLKQNYEISVDGKWIKYRAGFYYAIKNEDGTYAWERVSKDTYVQKTHDYVLIDGVKYPSLTYDANEAYYVYLWLSQGYKVLVTYDDASYYEVTGVEWNSQTGANAEYIVEYIGGHYLIRSGRAEGYTTTEEHYDITAPEALISVSTLPTTDIKTNRFYYLTASTNDYSKGVYHAIKNADNTYTWDKVGKELYIQKTTDYVELDGKQYPILTQDKLVSYYCYAMFKEGKKVLVTYNEDDYYEVINAEWYSGASSAETRYVVEYICDKWLIKTGRMGDDTFEEHCDITKSGMVADEDEDAGTITFTYEVASEISKIDNDTIKKNTNDELYVPMIGKVALKTEKQTLTEAVNELYDLIGDVEEILERLTTGEGVSP